MKIKYHRNKCIGCGVCANDAPHILEINNVDGKADLLDSELKSGCSIRILWPDEANIMADIVKRCSVRAIQLI
jgi:ferredoxin